MAIVSVVKYDGNPDVFAWKYPDSELGTWTQLIVNESQQAILFKGGQALDVLKLDATLSARTISPSWKRSSICPLEVSRHSAQRFGSSTSSSTSTSNGARLRLSRFRIQCSGCSSP